MLCHTIVNVVVFFVKSDENTYPKGRALIQMYRVVAITKRGNCVSPLFKQVYLIHLHRPVRFNGYPCPTSIHLWVSDDFLHEFQQQQPVVISHTLRGVENKHQVYHSTATFCNKNTMLNNSNQSEIRQSDREWVTHNSNSNLTAWHY